MIPIEELIPAFPSWLLPEPGAQPWNIVEQLEKAILSRIEQLSDDYSIQGAVAIHRTAVVEQGVVLKGAIIVSEQCFIGAHAYLRGPIFLGTGVKAGPGTEIKQSIVLDHTTMAHFNYVGNSILGRDVNLEAGSVCANHYNERHDKRIRVIYDGELIETGLVKFGTLIGDRSCIGANAVLSPGTILLQNSNVKRLELVEQVPDEQNRN